MSDEQRPGEYPSSSGNGSDAVGAGADDGYPTRDVPPRTGDSAEQGYPPTPPHGAYGPLPSEDPAQQPTQGYGQSGYDKEFPQGYGAQSPPGSGQRAAGEGKPATKPRAPIVVWIVVVAVVVAALIIAGIVWGLSMTPSQVQPVITPSASTTEARPERPSPEPQPSEEPAGPVDPTVVPTDPEVTPRQNGGPITRPTEPPDVNGQEPTSDGPPVMPSQVGEYQAVAAPAPEFGMYASEDKSDAIVVLYGSALSLDDAISELSDTERFGAWTCGVEPGAESGTQLCMSEAYDGIVTITGSGDAESTTTFGDEFLSLWK